MLKSMAPSDAVAKLFVDQFPMVVPYTLTTSYQR